MSSVKNPPRWAARQNPSYYIIFIHIPHNPYSISYNPSSKLRQGACFSMKASRPSAPKNSSREDLHTPDVSRLILCVDGISIKHTTNQLVSVSQEESRQDHACLQSIFAYLRLPPQPMEKLSAPRRGQAGPQAWSCLQKFPPERYCQEPTVSAPSRIQMLFVLVPLILTQYRVTERWRWKPKPIRVCSDMFSVNVWQWWKRSLIKGQLKQNKHLQTNDAPWKWLSLEWRPKESCLGCLSGTGCQTFGFEIIPICLQTPLETNFKQDWLASN